MGASETKFDAAPVRPWTRTIEGPSPPTSERMRTPRASTNRSSNPGISAGVTPSAAARYAETRWS